MIEPWWPLAAVAAIQLVDAGLSWRPVPFVAACLRDVHYPDRWWWLLSPVKVAAAVGLIVGIWVEPLALLTSACAGRLLPDRDHHAHPRSRLRPQPVRQRHGDADHLHRVAGVCQPQRKSCVVISGRRRSESATQMLRPLGGSCRPEPDPGLGASPGSDAANRAASGCAQPQGPLRTGCRGRRRCRSAEWPVRRWWQRCRGACRGIGPARCGRVCRRVRRVGRSPRTRRQPQFCAVTAAAYRWGVRGVARPCAGNPVRAGCGRRPRMSGSSEASSARLRRKCRASAAR